MLPWVALAAAIVLIDQLTKLAIERTFDYGDVEPITSFFNLVLTYNKGAAFSFLRRPPAGRSTSSPSSASGRRCSSFTCWPATGARGCFPSRWR